MRYFFYTSYKGTAYHGWQKQRNAISVQQVIEEALNKAVGSDVVISGSGRTDTGVHALEQVFHADIPDSVDSGSLMYSLNGILPRDIVINDIKQVIADAHARFDAVERSYEYRMHFFKSPFYRNELAFDPIYPDINAMNEAAATLIGSRDFTSFSKVKTDVSNFICTVMAAGWEPEPGGTKAIFRISANRFLRGMVRAIVGTLLDLGHNKLTLDEFIQIVAQRDRLKAGGAVPPYGLYLCSVKYPETIFNPR